MHDLNHTTAATETLQTPAPATASGPEDSAAPIRTKACRTCAQELPLTDFYRQRGCQESHRIDCKDCFKAHASVARAQRKTRERGSGEALYCRTCRASKPLSEFHPDRRCRIGYQRVCRTCRITPPVASQLPDDPDQPDKELEDERRIDLGLAIAAAIYPPGYCLSCEEIAAFTGLTESTVRKIERRALHKLHKAALRILRSKNLSLDGESEDQ